MAIVAAIPAFNEEIGLGSVIIRARQYVDEVVVIDDGSVDSTLHVAELTGVTILHHDKNFGKGIALRDVFRWAMDRQVDILVTLDADGQHNPDEIPRLIEPILQKKADIVNGARFLKGHSVEVPRYRRLGQEILTFATNLTAEVHLNDSQSGFRAFSRKTFSVFKFNDKGMGVESEMLAEAAAAGFKITEVPISCRYDVEGSTFNPVKHGMNVLASIINQFEMKRPLMYFGMPGFLLFSIGMVLAFRTLYIFHLHDAFAIGTALLAMTMTLTGLFMIFSGLILNSISKYFATARNDQK